MRKTTQCEHSSTDPSEHFPRTFGVAPHEHRIHVDAIDCLIESDRTPLNLADTIPSDAERTIADIALTFIHSGSTLQTGIGGIPNQIALSLAASDMGNFGVHSEMFTNGTFCFEFMLIRIGINHFIIRNKSRPAAILSF